MERAWQAPPSTRSSGLAVWYPLSAQRVEPSYTMEWQASQYASTSRRAAGPPPLPTPPSLSPTVKPYPSLIQRRGEQLASAPTRPRPLLIPTPIASLPPSPPPQMACHCLPSLPYASFPTPRAPHSFSTLSCSLWQILVSPPPLLFLSAPAPSCVSPFLSSRPPIHAPPIPHPPSLPPTYPTPTHPPTRHTTRYSRDMASDPLSQL